MKSFQVCAVVVPIAGDDSDNDVVLEAKSFTVVEPTKEGRYPFF